MKQLYLISILFMATVGCQGQKCIESDSFTSYSQALKIITSAKFKYVDEANTSKSSWIRGAKYYSCNSQLGYLIISINGKKYIHKDVPIEVWRNFKKANSFGSFYNNKLKNKYQLHIDRNR